jgi:uncharacterized protein YukE
MATNNVPNAYTNSFNGLIDLTTDMYQTYLKTVLMFQEQALDYTKYMLTRSEGVKKDSLKLADEFNGEVERSNKLVQDSWNNAVKTASETVKQYRDTTEDNLNTLTEQVNSLQTRVAETVAATTNGAKAATATATK